jgi:hypothetical protein
MRTQSEEGASFKAPGGALDDFFEGQEPVAPILF